MKKRIVKVISAVLAIGIVLSTYSAISADSKQNVSPDLQVSTNGFETILNNNAYSLGFNSQTGNIAVTEKKTGICKYASPLDADSDSLASIDTKSTLKSQVLVTFFADNGLTTFNSFAYCIEHKNLSYETKDDTLNVTYNLGDVSFSSDILPRVISKQRMEKVIFSKLSDDEKEQILERYILYSKKSLDKDTLSSMRLNFPSIDKQDIYVRESLPDYVAEDIYEIFKKTGYTVKDLQEDCDDNGIDNVYKVNPYFKITLKYTLTKDGFSVTVNPKDIEFLEGYAPTRIEILPYFGAGSINEKGYIFVPDGSGSIINFNNGKTTAPTYWKGFFNDDNAISRDESLTTTQPSVLPCFGISSDKGSVFATIENGYESAGICADIAGKLNLYNYAYPFFNIYQTDNVDVGSNGNEKYQLFGKKPLSSKITINYHFLKPSVSYSELALAYKKILKSNGNFPSETFKDKTVLNINLIGGISVTKKFLGIPYETIEAVTSYNDALSIINNFEKTNININYINALKGSLLQKSADKITMLPVLGSKKELKNLIKTSKNLTVSYYGEYAKAIKKNDTAQTLNRSTVKKSNFNIVSRVKENKDSLTALSSAKFNLYSRKIIDSLKTYNINSLNLRDLGWELNSDFRESSYADRGTARINAQNYLKNLSSKDKVSADIGSVYSFKYLTKIRNIPVTHSAYKIEDYSIPFYQIVVSGEIAFTIGSLNTAPDIDEAFLSTVETGGQLQFTWQAKRPDNIIRNCENYSNLLYKDSADKAKKYVQRYQSLYNKINGVAINNHTTIMPGVTKTIFNNGIVVVINHTDDSVSYNGQSVPAKDFNVSEREN